MERKDIEMTVDTKEKPPVRVEMDDAGSIRIVAYEKKGDWAGYESIASLETPEGLLIAVTAYYEGTLPIECVLSVKKVFDGGAGMVLASGHRPA